MINKILLVLFLCIAGFSVQAQKESSNTALILIDIQDFYFPDGAAELSEPIPAAEKAQAILKHFRKEGLLVVHVKHKAKAGAGIYELVKPIGDELVIEKTEVNAFNGTNLNEVLKANGIENLVVLGMQTHMCVEGAVRGAYDLGYKLALVEDACATRDLVFNDMTIEAQEVHLSTLATLKSYANVINSEDFFKKFPF
ncbi:cysteine hydrolase family protein [Carboxylicivirga sp. N1Y90]|uniref:cysteine hydrolase family protein n=1 Tax=Carboxylicivirga fragile TaxID=3417571 RepID=UPI003D345031|nr:cysteine hydrolase [Marinilabiliaceae bacterium N1Y90]